MNIIKAIAKVENVFGKKMAVVNISDVDVFSITVKSYELSFYATADQQARVFYLRKEGSNPNMPGNGVDSLNKALSFLEKR